MTKEELKAWRGRHGLTQEQAGKKLGVSLRTYQRMEDGTTGIRATYALMCQKLDKDLSEAQARIAEFQQPGTNRRKRARDRRQGLPDRRQGQPPA